MNPPRAVHPAAWWIWAICLAVAASRTSNVLMLGLLAAVTGYVVVARRGHAPWARAYGTFLKLGAFLIAFRVVLQALAGTPLPGRTLFTLPSVPLPDWAAGVRLGGPVTLEALVAGARAGLQLAVILACLGAANALASPARLLRLLPGALYEAAVAVTVALSFAPQAIVAAGEVREARRLRGRPTRGVRAVRGLAIPVLEGALERSVQLAASMDARGYGRPGATSRRHSTTAVFAGLLACSAGVYGMLDPGAPTALAPTGLGMGGALLAVGLALGGRRSGRSSYRPDPWWAAEWVVVSCGFAVAVAYAVTDATSRHPPASPLTSPALPLLAMLGAVAAGLPAWLTPAPTARAQP